MDSGTYDWRFTGDLEEFLGRAGSFLRSQPALHTVQLTVADKLRTEGLSAMGGKPPYFGWLADEDGTVRATVLRTPPYQLNLTSLTAGAADALAARLALDGRVIPSAGGPAETVAAFAAAWERGTGAAARLAMRQRLYRLGTFTPPEPAPPGSARVAGADDHGLVARWYAQFHVDVEEPAGQDPDRWAESRIAYGGITLWETPDGTPVAMAGATPEVAGQVRVAPVFTPAPLRGRGYAGAATASVTRAALDSGAEEVLLFTDLANPTSNGLYQRLGYEAVADYAVHEFSA
ncbi:GNAT family N-acetyltransferase [Streptomyces colonosanans]|uniref:GNAT family N-acetyltransferase n=1 Tax=Streptomyces colonosanans TaxID=1428652 RepID=A0A1S2PG78_9ACTN|nr:GNAT family N-acetyltransferase [Streptomyces colonosanans]OIJ92818.1 GNAT family N-acetyltransferase [Streptomyces colonosanans]